MNTGRCLLAIRAFQITLVSHDITNIFEKGLRIQGGLEKCFIKQLCKLLYLDK